MSKPFTKELFVKYFPKADIKVHEAFVKYFPEYEIDSTNRRAGFLSQCAHESLDFTARTENLNYSVNALMTTFKKYFPTEDSAKAVARQPEKIANIVYANRMGNGASDSGEGFLYRGRGFIQLTGKSNYLAFAKVKGVELAEIVKYLDTIEGAVESALWFWKDRGLNLYCDNDDIVGMTKKINGGTNGLADRTSYYELYKKVLA
jgi:putative chitinase